MSDKTVTLDVREDIRGEREPFNDHGHPSLMTETGRRMTGPGIF